MDPLRDLSENDGVLSRADNELAAVLIQNRLILEDQVKEARSYARGRRCDLRQAILELNLITSDRLGALAFERLSALAGGNPGFGQPADAGLMPLLPDRAKLQRDIRAELAQAAENATAPELLDQILQRAFDSRATDVHFDPLPGGLRVRYRIDGQLHEVLQVETSSAHSLVGRLKVISNLKIVERRHAQDGHFTFVYGDRAHTLRVSTIPTDLGERVVLRLHEALNMALGFPQLGLMPAQVDQLRRLIARPYGALLVGGPVGAGKTTTLYSCLQQVNEPTRNLMTIEDPIEYRIPGVNQVQVDTHNGMDFAEGLRAILRQDPNVLMIGEIRDDETARIGIRAALTGVLVLSTIHSSDAASTIGTLYNYGLAGYLLSGAIQGVVSQRLVRRVCPYCRVGRPAAEADLAALGLEPDEHAGKMLHRGRGCNACFQTGYLGRIGVFEIMEITPLIREMILNQTSKDVLCQLAREEGMRTMKEVAADRVLEGATTVEEVHRLLI